MAITILRCCTFPIELFNDYVLNNFRIKKSAGKNGEIMHIKLLSETQILSRSSYHKIGRQKKSLIEFHKLYKIGDLHVHTRNMYPGPR